MEPIFPSPTLFRVPYNIASLAEAVRKLPLYTYTVQGFLSIFVTAELANPPKLPARSLNRSPLPEIVSAVLAAKFQAAASPLVSLGLRTPAENIIAPFT